MERQIIPTLAFLALVTMSGCTSLFFHPTATRYPLLELEKLSARPVSLQSRDGTMLSAWEIDSNQVKRDHPEVTRGIALQFHGNAQNMTSHFQFQTWLLYEGWDVLTFDYRGYGMSAGEPSNLQGVLHDGIVAIRWANQIAREKKLPLVIFAQSIGSNIAISALDEMSLVDDDSYDRLKILVVDSGFYSFTSIARERLSNTTLLWPLQWLGWLLISNDLSAGPRLKAHKPHATGPFQTSAIFLHSINDPVVSNRQGEMLYDIYPGEKIRWTTIIPGHVNSPHQDRLRERLRTIQGAFVRTTKVR